MRTHTFRSAAALAALLLAATPAAAQDGWEWSGSVPRGGTLRLLAQNGDVQVRAASGAAVRVAGDAEGRDAGEVRFETVRSGDDVIVCALVSRNARCTAEGIREEGRRGWSWGNSSRARASLAVELPRGVELRASSGNGDVTVEGTGSDVHASTGNGDVRVSGTAGTVRASTGNGAVRVASAAGPVTASTGNGRVEVATAQGPVTASSGNGDVLVRMARAGDGDVRASTGNGSVRLEVPRGFSGRVEATSGTGSIDAELPLRIEGRANRYRLSGTLGDGSGPRVRLSTGAGRVVLAPMN